MSDSTVIDNFVGEYESDGVITPSSPAEDKKLYYPRKGVKLKLEKVPMDGDPGKAYAKIRIKPDGAPFGAKVALERAVFRVHENKLIADNIELSPGMLLQETLTMENSNGEKRMKHTLNFSDETLGTWVCKP
jgi:hypothetical protein